ncbi:MAG: polyprenyl synthetase family protein [Candidatus Micrarchaeia archaeon]
MDVFDEDAQMKAVVEKQIEAILPRGKKPFEVYGIIWDFLDRGGKRFRPLMCMTACEAVGGNPKNAIAVAASIELFHNFTLVHDDIEDNSQMRRGKPCLHVSYGLPLALNAGDGLFMASWKSILESPISPQQAVEVGKCLYDAYLAVLEGQAVELNWHENNIWGITLDGYKSMVRGKTGALIGGACKAGAIIGGSDANVQAALWEFGNEVGVAFQIQDDILNVTGDFKKYKKEIGGDIVEGKRTVMVIDLLTKCTKAEAAKCRTILGNKKTTKAQVEYVIGLMKKYDSISYAASYADGLLKSAKERLAVLPDNKASKKLRKLADFLVDREV